MGEKFQIDSIDATAQWTDNAEANTYFLDVSPNDKAASFQYRIIRDDRAPTDDERQAAQDEVASYVARLRSEGGDTLDQQATIVMATVNISAID